MLSFDKILRMSLPKVPHNLFSYNEHQLCFEGIPLAELEPVKNYHEPVLIYKKSLIEDRLRLIKSWPRLFQVHFALKANFHSEVLALLKKHDCGLDVVSGGEIHAGLEAGFSPEAFIFSGVGKTKAELQMALNLGIYQINVESPSELRRIAEMTKASTYSDLTKSAQKKISLGLRVNPLINGETHPYISTALQDSKFGIDLIDVPECLQIFRENSQLELKCISFHIGSQIMKTDVFKEAVDKMRIYYEDLQKEFKSLTRFDLGGGLGIDYHDHDVSKDFKRWHSLIEKYDDSLKNFNGDILLEIGRFIIARAAVFISQVQYIKKQNMLVLDLGMNNNLRPSLYQAHHHFYNLVKRDSQIKNYSIVGPICESTDIFHKNFELYPVQEGDLLVKADCGAYVRSMANQYNLRNVAQEIFIS